MFVFGNVVTYATLVWAEDNCQDFQNFEERTLFVICDFTFFSFQLNK